MDFTKQEILNRNGIDFDAFNLEHEYSAKNLLAAMDEYAEQEAKAYASWLSNTVIRGRTASKLWADYKAEIGPKNEAPTCQRIEEVARLFDVPAEILQKMQPTPAFSIVEAADEYVFNLCKNIKLPKAEAPTCTTCGSPDTYTTTAYHCRRCATTTEM